MDFSTIYTAENVEFLIQALRSDARELCIRTSRDFVPEPMTCVRLALALASNRSLVSLRLEECSDIVAQTVAEALKDNHSLEMLDVDVYSSEAAFAMAELLKRNDTLKSFRLDAHDEIGDDMGCAIAAALKNNVVLQSFFFEAYYSNIGDDTGYAMAEALEANDTLQSFTFLAGRGISDEAGCAIAEALKLNDTLHSFSLDAYNTQIGGETVCAIAAALKTNVVLRSFELTAFDTGVGEETRLPLEEALEGNFSLTHFEAPDLLDARKWTNRNAEVLAQWRCLVALARTTDDFYFGSLVPRCSRSAVFAFLLPSSCRFASRWLSASGWTGVLHRLPVALVVTPSAQASDPPSTLPSSFQTRPSAAAASAEAVAVPVALTVTLSGPESDLSSDPPHMSASSLQTGPRAAEVSVEFVAAEGQKESEQIAMVLRQSRLEGGPALNRDGVVLLRLTRCARVPEVQELLLQSPALAECRRRVEAAACEVSPAWAGGAKFFIPCTEQQLGELAEAGFELFEHHILALEADKARIEEALQDLPRKRRPRLALEVPSDEQEEVGSDRDVQEELEPLVEVECAFATDSSLGFPSWAEDRF